MTLTHPSALHGLQIRAPPQESFAQTTFEASSFFGAFRHLFVEKVVKTQLERLKESGAYDCFQLQWHPCYNVKRSVNGCSAPGGSPPSFIWASDIGKWIEAACYFLADPVTAKSTHADEFRLAIDKLVAEMQGAQEPDGYLNAYFQVVDPAGKLKNLRDMCEGYSCGHLVEAAIAHYHLTGSRVFLDIMIKNLECFMTNFGPESHQRPGYPGHPELELAALRLYRITGDQRHYDFARWLLQERGKRPGSLGGLVYLDWEADQRGDKRHPTWLTDLGDHSYSQSHKPLHDQTDIVGHSVQAFYLLTAAADMGGEFAQDARRLFDDAIDTKMYVTGGFGSDPATEGFHDLPYYLPPSTAEGGCYAETCASISAMMVAERLLSSGLDAGYRSTLECCLYNNVLGGASLDAESFYYWNKLASSDGEDNKRSYWYEVCCCPPNLARTIGMLGGYLWSARTAGSQVTVDVHVYAAASRSIKMADGRLVSLTMRTAMPWSGGVEFEAVVTSGASLTLNLPVPAYADNFKVRPFAMDRADGQVFTNFVASPGYAQVTLSHSCTFNVAFDLPVRLLVPDIRTNQDTLTVSRGPIVYCVEGVDNVELVTESPHFRTVGLAELATFDTVPTDVGGVHVVMLKTADVFLQTMSPGQRLYRTVEDPSLKWEQYRREVTFVPFFARATRGGIGQHRTSLHRVKRSDMNSAP